MKYKSGHFRTFKSKADIRLAFANPNGEPPKILSGDKFQFDGFVVKLDDGRCFERAEGIQGMIDKGFANEVTSKTKRIVHSPKKKNVSSQESNVLFDALDSALESLDSQEEEDLEEEDLEEDGLEEDGEDEDEDDDSSWEDYEDDSFSDEDAFDDFDDFDEDWDEEENIDLGNGISFRNQSRTVKSGREFSVKRPASLEDSARASVGSTSQTSDGGVYVGSGGGGPTQTKTANRVREEIGLQEAMTTQTVMIVPDIGVGNTQTAERINVSEMGRNSIERMESGMGNNRAIPVGQAKKIASKMKKAEALKKQKLEKMIEKRAKVLEGIRKKIPNFKWDLKASPEKRFEKAISIYDRSKTSNKAKRNLEAILRYELPEMKKRIQQQIDFERTPRRG